MRKYVELEYNKWLPGLPATVRIGPSIHEGCVSLTMKRFGAQRITEHVDVDELLKAISFITETDIYQM